MSPILQLTFIDVRGRRWKLYEFSFVDRKKVKRPIGDHRSEARAFVPYGWKGDVMIYAFGQIAYREITDRLLQQQLDAAKPLSRYRETSLNPLPDPAGRAAAGSPDATSEEPKSELQSPH